MFFINWDIFNSVVHTFLPFARCHFFPLLFYFPLLHYYSKYSPKKLLSYFPSYCTFSSYSIFKLHQLIIFFYCSIFSVPLTKYFQKNNCGACNFLLFSNFRNIALSNCPNSEFYPVICSIFKFYTQPIPIFANIPLCDELFSSQISSYGILKQP